MKTWAILGILWHGLSPIPPKITHKMASFYQVRGKWRAQVYKAGIRHSKLFERKGEAQAFIVWDADANKSQAFLGVQFVLRGSDRVGQMIWLTGENRAAWAHLFTELQVYLRDHQGCKAMTAIARPGWSKHLKSNGFKETHRVFEKELP